MTGELVSGANGVLDPQHIQGWFVEMKFKGDGGKIWANIPARPPASRSTPRSG